MSNQRNTGALMSAGQSGKPLNISFDRLNEDERIVLGILRESGRKLRLRQIVEVTGWEALFERVKANSKVRNAMRRLVRSGMVMHNRKIGDGTYMVPDIAPAEALTVAPAGANPVPVDIDVITRSAMAAGRKSDCSFYNACLDQAISKKWDGFSCLDCSAYAEPDEFQKEQDILGLRAVQTAADLAEKHGKVNRIRGVKPGTEIKKRRLMPVLSASEA